MVTMKDETSETTVRNLFSIFIHPWFPGVKNSSLPKYQVNNMNTIFKTEDPSLTIRPWFVLKVSSFTDYSVLTKVT